MPIRNAVSPEETVRFLNEALATDSDAINALFRTAVPCNEALADHPTIQVKTSRTPGLMAEVRLIGLFNGLFGTDADGWGCISANTETDTGKIVSFSIIENRRH